VEACLAKDSSIVEFIRSQILRRFAPQDDNGDEVLMMTMAKGSLRTTDTGAILATTSIILRANVPGHECHKVVSKVMFLR
jgi:hypothetical protein